MYSQIENLKFVVKILTLALIINIETATQVCSVALAKDGKLLALKETDSQNSHASQLTCFIDEALREQGYQTKDLDAIAVSSGPGSYTGLRIGYSTAKGLCYALDKPMIKVSTLQALAMGAKEPNKSAIYCPMIDARRMEVYCALYDKDVREIHPVEAKVLDDTAFQEVLSERQVIFCGNGAFKMPQVVESSNVVVKNTACSAINMIFLSYEAYKNAIFEDIAYATPLYIKAPFITKPKKRL